MINPIMKYILVTGGAGYIGTHTVVELINNGFTPVIVDDFRNSNHLAIQGIESITKQQLHVHEFDLCDLSAVKTLFSQYSFDGIIHFAAYKAVGESVSFPLKYYTNNLQSLANVLACMIEFQVNNLVFSSSCTVYGDPAGIK
jgi:UDP-glucose 4-epimerase